MIAEFNLILAPDDEANKWHCIIGNQNQYSRFEKRTLNSTIKEMKVRLEMRLKENRLFPLEEEEPAGETIITL